MIRMRYNHVVILVCSLLFLSGCLTIDNGKVKDLHGELVVLVIASEDFNYLEYSTIRSRVEAANGTVLVASNTLTAATSSDHRSVNPDILLSDVDVNTLDALVFIGGAGCTIYFNDVAALELARGVFNHGKVIGAICYAPVILMKAGVLDDRNATVHQSFVSLLEDSGVKVLDKPVVRDGRVLTGNGPDAAEDFSRELVDMLIEYQ